MKSKTIFTIVAIVAALGIMATVSIGSGLQQASASACNIFADNGHIVKETGNSCNQNPNDVQGTDNIHIHLQK